jgi:hypothetical protein
VKDEAHALKVVELGHTDPSHSTALYMPSIALVASGDSVYNTTHLYLAELCRRLNRRAGMQPSE